MVAGSEFQSLVVIGIKELEKALFFYENDERRSYTKKVQLPKAWVGPSIVKRRRKNFMGWAGVEGICGYGS